MTCGFRSWPFEAFGWAVVPEEVERSPNEARKKRQNAEVPFERGTSVDVVEWKDDEIEKKRCDGNDEKEAKQHGVTNEQVLFERRLVEVDGVGAPTDKKRKEDADNECAASVCGGVKGFTEDVWIAEVFGGACVFGVRSKFLSESDSAPLGKETMFEIFEKRSVGHTNRLHILCNK